MAQNIDPKRFGTKPMSFFGEMEWRFSEFENIEPAKYGLYTPEDQDRANGNTDTEQGKRGLAGHSRNLTGRYSRSIRGGKYEN